MKYVNFIGIVALIVLAYFLGAKRAKLDMPKYDNNEYILLRRQIDSLNRVVIRKSSEIEIHKESIDSLENINAKNTSKINEIRSQFENEMVRMDGIPDDNLFRFFAEYLEKFNDSKIQ